MFERGSVWVSKEEREREFAGENMIEMRQKVYLERTQYSSFIVKSNVNVCVFSFYSHFTGFKTEEKDIEWKRDKEWTQKKWANVKRIIYSEYSMASVWHSINDQPHVAFSIQIWLSSANLAILECDFESEF